MFTWKTIALAPLLAIQGLWVRAHALKLPEAEGLRAGEAGNGPELRLLIVGDSSAAGVGVAHQDQALAGQLVAELAQDFTVTWRLEAKTGAVTRGTLERLRKLELEPVDVVIQALGVNDVTGQVSLRNWLSDQAQLNDLYVHSLGAKRVYRTGLPPMGEFPILPRPLRTVLGARARQFDTALRAASVEPTEHVAFEANQLDTALMAEDGFHPGPQIYKLWAQDLAERIRAACKV